MKIDTIAAIATAMTNSGIGIIRISGEEAFTVIDNIYRSKNKKKKLSELHRKKTQITRHSSECMQHLKMRLQKGTNI